MKLDHGSNKLLIYIFSFKFFSYIIIIYKNLEVKIYYVYKKNIYIQLLKKYIYCCLENQKIKTLPEINCVL